MTRGSNGAAKSVNDGVIGNSGRVTKGYRWKGRSVMKPMQLAANRGEGISYHDGCSETGCVKQWRSAATRDKKSKYNHVGNKV